MAFDPKKITDAKEMTKLQEGFYLLVDSPTQGTRKFCTDAFIAPPEPPVPPEPTHDYLYKWDFTKSLTDEVSSKNVTLYNNATRDNTGAHINGAGQQLYFDAIDMIGKTIEIDVSYFDFQGGSNGTATFLINNRDPNAPYKRLSGSFIYFGSNGWGSRGWKGADYANFNTGMLESYYGSSLGVNDISGKTIKVEYLDAHTQKAYIDGQLIGTVDNVYLNNYGGNHTCKYLWIGGWGNSTDTCYNMTVTGVRIYENEEE